LRAFFAVALLNGIFAVTHMSQYIYIAAAFLIGLSPEFSFATDRSFADIVAFSPNNAWRITAASPDNGASERRPWQGDFVYSAYRDGEAEPLWTRKQSAQNPYEESPVRIVVADNGWVAIHTGGDQLVFIDPAGENRGRVNEIKSFIPQAELATHGVGSSGGLIWSPHSLWYFLPVGGEQVFVVRLWWGRRVVISPESGKPIQETEDLRHLMNRAERERAISLLAAYSSGPIPDADASQILLGAYLAGVLRIEEVTPWLRQLEESNYIGIDSIRLGSDRSSAVDPFSFRCYTARQVSRLSLRRLRADVGSTPVYEFRIAGTESGYYRPQSKLHSNERDFSRVQVGMNPENVLDIVGSPDFVVGDCWEFDVAGSSQATFVIEWEDGRVAKTDDVAPKWVEGLERDLHVALF
jgi:hypothetical protein